jgi:hypothetical protein
MASGKPTPDIRIGLVAYRDKGDDYVTKVFPLTDDLDAVFRNLTEFAADGGGDGPESVNQALADAVHKAGWSDESAGAVKIIFLVGDAPPHMDYSDDVKYQKTVEDAVRADIMVNAVQCGGDTSTRGVWTEIARLGEGRYVAIDQSGGMESVATPFDAKLTELERKAASTVMYYGTAEEKESGRRSAELAKDSADKAKAAAPEAAAERAVVMGEKGFASRPGGGRDLVSAILEGKEDLSKLDPKLLPEELKGKSVDEIKAIIEARMAERKAAQEEMKALAEKRADFIRKELEKKGAEDSFDAKVKEMIKAKAEKAGIKFE